MKCYKCGRNEANSRLLVNYMGHAAELYLCSQCLQNIKQYATSILKDGGENGMPYVQPYTWPIFDVSAPRGVAPGESSGDCFPLDAGDAIKRRRRAGELKEKLRAAVEAEDYETAAKIRDEIYLMEKEVCV